MMRLLGSLPPGTESSPREITPLTAPLTGGDSGWLLRFFDSAFFCEWIAVSYLYKHDHAGVRDYLCNRMYTLPLHGIESYLFQICYMLVYKPSPSLDKFVIDICAKSLPIALKVHWFLMAELEDSNDSEGMSSIQEKCQIAATLNADWPPLVHAPNVSIPMLSRILSFASSKDSSDDNFFKKLIPSPKVRDNLLFRKSVEKEGEETDGEGFFWRFLRDSKDKEDGDGERDGFFRRMLRDSKDGNEELTSSSDGIFKRVFGDKEEMLGEEEKEGFFRKMFKEKSEEKKDGENDRNEEKSKKDSFFRKVFKEKSEEKKDGHERSEDDDKGRGSVKDDDKGGFFKRLFKDKHEEKKVPGHDWFGEEDKCNESMVECKDNEHEMSEVEDKGRGSVEDDDKVGFFKSLFQDKREEEKVPGNDRFGEEDKCNGSMMYSKDNGHDQSEDEDKDRGSVEDDDKGSFFKRLFKDKHEEKKVAGHDRFGEEDKSNRSMEDTEKEGFFKRFFKDRHDERKDEVHRKNEGYKLNGNLREEETMEFLSFRRMFRVHPEVVETMTVSENDSSGVLFESSSGTENFFRRLFSDRDCIVEDSELFGSKKVKEKHPGSPRQRDDKSYAKPPFPNSVTSQIRKGTYHGSLEFVQSLCDTSYDLVDIFPIEDRQIALRESLQGINAHLSAAKKGEGVCFPMGKGMYRVVHIPEDEAVLLNSREKAPYLICLEVVKGEVLSHTKLASDSQKLSRGGIHLANGDSQLPKPHPWAYPLWNQRDMHRYEMMKSTSQAIDQAMSQLWEAKVKFVHASLSVEKQYSSNRESDSGHIPPIFSTEAKSSTSADVLRTKGDNDMEWISVNLFAVPGVNMDDISYQNSPRPKGHRRVPSTIAIEEVKNAAAKGQTPPGLPLKGAVHNSSDAQPKVTNGSPKPNDALSGELWEVKKDRIRSSSAYGKTPGWELRSMIVKSGDDCRQEHLAVQLISHFYDIYQEADLPLWLRPYEVLVTSSYTALIETISDTASIHSIKSRFPNISSLRDFFVAKYEENSPTFKLAQRNFVESMAGYSILCYILQVKDRHNGNLLIDEEGHIIHIDFGFFLSNSPGGVNFESAPFKLTRELLEVMDSDSEGNPSEFFDYFKVLCIQGFLTCRKHAERIILLVEMLQNSGFPCFKGGPRTIQNLRKRFHLSLTEEQCVSLVLSLISSSLDAWRTRQYDYYQWVLNGIL